MNFKDIRMRFLKSVIVLSLVIPNISTVTAFANEAGDEVQTENDGKDIHHEEGNASEEKSELDSETLSNEGKNIEETSSDSKSNNYLEKEISKLYQVIDDNFKLYMSLDKLSDGQSLHKTTDYKDQKLNADKSSIIDSKEYVRLIKESEVIGWINVKALKEIIDTKDNIENDNQLEHTKDLGEEKESITEDTKNDEIKNNNQENTEEVNKKNEESQDQEQITPLKQHKQPTAENFVTSSSVEQPNLKIRAHIQSKGWMNWSTDNTIIGTTGESLQMEAFQVENEFENLTVQFQTQSAGQLWTNWVNQGSTGGTTGQRKGLEGVSFRLSGSASSNFDIYYRVHSQKFGWLPWTKNGQKAGTSGFDYTIESMQVTIRRKGGDTLKTSPDAYQTLKNPNITYRAHVSSKGWLNWVPSNSLAGTIGQGLSMEAFDITSDNPYAKIQFQTRSIDGDWTPWTKEYETAGTVNEGRQLEGVRLQLYGVQSSKFDIYYRVHSQKFGWLPWAKNGEKAGTEGYGYGVEGLQVKVMPKGQSTIDVSGNPFRLAEQPTIKYQSHVQTYGWQDFVGSNSVSGTVGKKKRLEAVRIDLEDFPVDGGIKYRTHVEGYGWRNHSVDGALNGTIGKGKRLEALEVELTGELANKYDIYYRTHIESYGWLGWVKNGMPSGSSNKALRMEGLQIKIFPKGKGGKVDHDKGYVNTPLIYIDSGHGGKYPGAAYGGVFEKTINLQTTRKIESILKAKGYRTKMSRTTDRHFENSLTPDLRHRADEANKLNADIFISVHFNAHPTSTQTGIEMYIYNKKGNSRNPNIANNATRISKSRSLASKMQSELIKQTGAADRGVKEANFHVIRETHMPAVLLELGFMDNPNDLKKIKTNSYQDKLARGVTNGIDDFFGK